LKRNTGLRKKSNRKKSDLEQVRRDHIENNANTGEKEDSRSPLNLGRERMAEKQERGKDSEKQVEKNHRNWRFTRPSSNFEEDLDL